MTKARDIADRTVANAALPKAGGAMTGAIAMGTSKVTGAGDPTAAQDVATKAYVDSSSGSGLPLSGGAMTGPITTNSTFDGVDIAARDAVLTSTTTTANAALPKAGGAVTGNVTFGDGNKAIFGAGSDLQIYSDGTTSRIYESGSGLLTIRASNFNVNTADGSESYITMVDGGAVTSYHNGAAKIATSASGISVTGALAATAPDANGNAVFTRSGTSETLTIGTFYVSANGNDLQLNTTANATIDAAGDITLDADGGDVIFKDGGSEYARFTQNNSGLRIQTVGNNCDFVVLGNDGGLDVAAMTLDMSEAGAATFNSTVTATGFSGKIYSTSGNTNYYLQLKDTNELNFFNANSVSDTIHINYDGGSVDLAKSALLARNAGAVTTSYQPAFKANADTQTNLGSGWQKILYDTSKTARNVTGSTSYSSSRFTAPVNGWYFFSASYNSTANSDADGTLVIGINGSDSNVVSSTSAPSTSGHTYNPHFCAGSAYLSANDYVEVYRYSTVTTTTRTSLPYGGWFSGHLIG